MAVTERVRQVVRPDDTVARFGGDEFVIVCDDTDVTEAKNLADRLIAAIREPFQLNGRRQYISASIGIAVAPPLACDADELLRYADNAMYEAKARGRSRYRVFDESLAMRSLERLELSNELRDALAGDALDLYYQPVIRL